MGSGVHDMKITITPTDMTDFSIAKYSENLLNSVMRGQHALLEEAARQAILYGVAVEDIGIEVWADGSYHLKICSTDEKWLDWHSKNHGWEK